jgi:hypothetical protein
MGVAGAGRRKKNIFWARARQSAVEGADDDEDDDGGGARARANVTARGGGATASWASREGGDARARCG